MPNIFRNWYTLPIPAGAELVNVKGVPSARYTKRDKKKTSPLTDHGKRIRVPSKFWYASIDGKNVKLFTDAIASQARLTELLRKAERGQTGLSDPFEEHAKRPLLEHVDDWAANLRNRGKGEKHARATSACARRVIEACRFTRIGDISASSIERFLADLRSDPPALDPLDLKKSEYTKAELAAALGIHRSAVPSLVRRHRRAAKGKGKARRYPRETVEALRERRARGSSIKTANLYLSAMKALCNFLVRDRRAAANPLAHLRGLDPQHDRRHDRRFLDEKELGAVIGAAARSDSLYRGLSGPDRAMLYRLACTSGFRAAELAALCPHHFDLDAALVSLPGIFTKNKKAAEQPLPPGVTESLRGYLAGKPNGKPIWPGSWHERAAEMFRIDLDAAGIAYVIDGPDGPQYADFHCLRHSYIALLDRTGATLKEAMALARHSDPKLTMKVYGKARRHDLAGAVDRFPVLQAKEGMGRAAKRA